jgi:hypothetical protein
MLLIRCLEPPLQFQLVLDIPFSYLPAALMSEAAGVTAILVAVALCYSISLYSVLYLDIGFIHRVYFQQPANLKTPKT